MVVSREYAEISEMVSDVSAWRKLNSGRNRYG